LEAKWFGAAFCILCLATVLQGQSRDSVLRSVAESSDWRPSNTPVEYDENSVEQIPGPYGPLFKRYGFVGATAQNWNGPGGAVALTLYQMIDSSSAYAVLTLIRDISQRGYAPATVGAESFRNGNQLWFWQSRYLVGLNGEPAEDLARVVSANILGRSSKPPVATLLPSLYLAPGSDRYILYPEDLDRKLGLDPATLGFDENVEIATATYRVDNKAADLVLLLYPTQQMALKYVDQWQASEDTPAFRKRVGPLVAWVRGARDGESAEKILGPVNYETQVTWNEPRPDIPLRDLILTIFTFTGLALLFVVIAGISFGGLRVFVKARYPNKIFDRPEDMEIIQLKLPKGVTPRQLNE
jgi:hypothetical protein